MNLGGNLGRMEIEESLGLCNVNFSLQLTIIEISLCLFFILLGVHHNTLLKFIILSLSNYSVH